jgi:gliding motility-associated-like protein
MNKLLDYFLLTLVGLLFNHCLFAQNPTVLFPTDTTVCTGTSVILNSINDGETEYIWTASDPTFGTTTQATPRVTVKKTTTYFLKARKNDITMQKSITFNVIKPETVNIINNDTSVCRGTTIELKARGTGNGTYMWVPGGAAQSIQVAPRIHAQYEVIYYYGAKKCEAHDTVNIKVTDPFFLAIDMTSRAQTVRPGENIALKAVTDLPLSAKLIYTWTENSKPFGSNSPIISAQPNRNPSIYTVKATDSRGCSQTATLALEVLPLEIKMPTAFTPNNDNENDLLGPVVVNGGDFTVKKFQVFDRWGNLVHENAQDKWDGKHNSVDMPQGIYIYYVEVVLPNGVYKILKGDVFLMR